MPLGNPVLSDRVCWPAVLETSCRFGPLQLITRFEKKLGAEVGEVLFCRVEKTWGRPWVCQADGKYSEGENGILSLACTT